MTTRHSTRRGQLLLLIPLLRVVPCFPPFFLLFFEDDDEQKFTTTTQSSASSNWLPLFCFHCRILICSSWRWWTIQLFTSTYSRGLEFIELIILTERKSHDGIRRAYLKRARLRSYSITNSGEIVYAHRSFLRGTRVRKKYHIHWKLEQGGIYDQISARFHCFFRSEASTYVALYEKAHVPILGPDLGIAYFTSELVSHCISVWFALMSLIA